jgi:hypothetical protein
VGASGAAAAATLEGFSRSHCCGRAIVRLCAVAPRAKPVRTVPALGSFSAQARGSGPPLPALAGPAVAPFSAASR